MKLKAAIFDVDGTLFDYHDQKIHKSTIEAILELKQRNILTIIATARSYPELSDACRQVIAPDYYVCASGQNILDCSGRSLYAENFSFEQTNRIIALAEQVDAGLTLKYAHVNCLYRHPSEMRMIYENIGQNSFPFLICETMDYHFKHLPIGFTLRADKHVRTLLENMLHEFTNDYRLELFRNGMVADVFLPHVRKVTALQYLTARLQVNPSSCIAFGDGTNDIEMIRWAGLGVAMGNGRDELKAIADYVCENAWEDGISNTIHSILKTE